MTSSDPLKPVRKLLTVTTVAEFCDIAPETVRRLTDRGAMPMPVRLGRAVRYRLDEIDSWINDGCPNLSKRRGRR
jgi:excisionase family DNA binding protein